MIVKIGETIFLLFFLSSNVSFAENSLDVFLKNAGLEDFPKLLNVKVEQSYAQTQNKGAEAEFNIGKFEEGTYFAEMYRGVSAEQAQKRILQKGLQIESVYEGVQDPYFAAITKKTGCPKDLELLQLGDKKTRFFYSGFANTNGTLGLCMRGDIRFVAQVATIFCAKKGTLVYLTIQKKLRKEIPSLKERLAMLDIFSRLKCEGERLR